jgi:CO/xanthine dehydrogenase Mo-binding subunit
VLLRQARGQGLKNELLMTQSLQETSGPGPGAERQTTDDFGFRVVHHSVPRADGKGKVTGQATYTADLQPARLAFAKVLRSPVAHARIRSIDTSAALGRPGVIAVVSGEDLGSLSSSRYGHALKDHPVIAVEKVRFIGEAVAAVIAEDEASARRHRGRV